MTDRVGQQLGNYRLIRLLGKGGFAEVYLGAHVYLKSPAAIKLLQTKVANEQDLQVFLKEAQTIARLVHPHIVRVLEFGLEGETPFLVMDYAPYGTLRQRHPKGTQLPLMTILPYVKHVAEALRYAHEEQFIHRDVKPENMLMGRQDAVLLSDFGIALVAQSSRYQSTQEVIGTVAYMSPEQIQGKPRPASDQYSLGIVVYEWLTGTRPFHGSFTELCTQHMFAPPPPLHEKNSTISTDVEAVVMKALAKDPKLRFAHVQDFATALEQAYQAAPPRPMALPSELPSPRQPLPPTDTGAAFRSSQIPGPPNGAPSSPPPTKTLSATPLAASFAASHPPNDENTPPVPKIRSISALANRRQGLHRSRIVLLLGLALFVLLGSLGLFTLLRTNQMTTGNAANAVATLVQAKYATATIQARVAATVTATTAYNHYVQATSGTPGLDDPLSDNSKGNRWYEGTFSFGTCFFQGAAYHAIAKAGYYSAACTGFVPLRDFAFQVQVAIVRGDGGGGIAFRLNANGAYLFEITPQGSYTLFKNDFHRNTFIPLLTGSSTAIIKGLNQFNLVAAVTQGDTIELFINHHYVGYVQDATYSEGYVGIWALAARNPVEVVLRNAKVWAL